MKKLFQNIPLKIVSVLVAVILWFVIMSFADPSTTRTINYIPVSLINDQIIADGGKAYTVDGNLYASVHVTGKNSIVTKLTASDFTAVADISKMYDLTGQVPVEIICHRSDVTASQLEPVTRSIHIVTEDIRTKQFTVEVDVEGKLADGLQLGSISLNPNRVIVRAQGSVMDKIARAAVGININGISEPTSFETDIVLYDAEGQPLNFSSEKNFSQNVQTVTVKTEVFSVKTLPIVYTVQNQNLVEEGFRFTGAELSVSAVQVSGLKSRLAELSQIVIPEGRLDVKGADADRSVTISLISLLPDAITIVNKSDEILTVTLKVEQLKTQTYDLINQIQIINRDPNYEYTVTDKRLTVFFRALKEDFNHFSVDQVTVTLDAAALNPGTHYVPLKITVADSVFEVVNMPSVSVKVTDTRPPETQPQTDEPENP